MREILIRRGDDGSAGIFDADKRLQALSARGDPLEAIDHLVPWESFRAEIEAVVLTPDELKKSSAGRKPFDAILMFRMLVLQALPTLPAGFALSCHSHQRLAEVLALQHAKE